MPAFQVGSACYGSALGAARAFVSGQPLVTLQVDGVPVVGVPSVAGDEETAQVGYTYQHPTTGQSVQVLAPYDAQPCGLIDWPDALQLSWLVAAVWLAVYAVNLLAKARS